jgi:hypothetical protein
VSGVEVTAESTTSNPATIRRYEVVEDVGRIGWPPPKPVALHLLSCFRFCAYLHSRHLPGSFVIANAWTRESAITKARKLWFEHLRFVTGDEDSSNLCGFVPAPQPEDPS